jgi:hypothetical protein
LSAVRGCLFNVFTAKLRTLRTQIKIHSSSLEEKAIFLHHSSLTTDALVNVNKIGRQRTLLERLQYNYMSLYNICNIFPFTEEVYFKV